MYKVNGESAEGHCLNGDSFETEQEANADALAAIGVRINSEWMK